LHDTPLLDLVGSLDGDGLGLRLAASAVGSDASYLRVLVSSCHRALFREPAFFNNFIYIFRVHMSPPCRGKYNEMQSSGTFFLSFLT
jgi:hypothetical protein